MTTDGSRWIALLRAVNVGGNNKVPMAELRALMADLGVPGARTLLQSGNLVFTAPGTAAEWGARLEAEIAARIGPRIDVMLRDAAEWTALMAANPFPDTAEARPNRLLVTALKSAPEEEAARALEASVTGPERLRVIGREIFVAYNDAMVESRLTNGVIEKALGRRGTARNWNTVGKLAVLAAS